MPYGDLDLKISVLGHNTNINGKLSFHNYVRIDGEITGEITSKSKIYLSKTSVVNANIKSNELILSGKLNGNISAKSFVIKTGAVFTGTVESKNFIIEDGAQVNLKGLVK